MFLTYLSFLLILLNFIFSRFFLPTLINPISLFSVGWLFPLYLSLIFSQYYNFIFDINFINFLTYVSIIMELCILFFLLPVLKFKIWRFNIQNKYIEDNYYTLLVNRLNLLIFISIISLIASYVHIGSVPVLDSSNYKFLRRELRMSNFYTLYSFSMISVVMLIYVSYLNNKILPKISKFLLLLWFFLSSLTGWAGNIAYPIIMILSAYAIAEKNRDKEKNYIIKSFVIVMIAFFFISYIRAVYNHGLTLSFGTFFDEKTYARFFIYLTHPIYNLQDVYQYSEFRASGSNTFLFLSKLPMIGDNIRHVFDEWLSVFINEIGNNIYNRAANTITFIAPLYIDFGKFFIIPIILMSVFYSKFYVMAIKSKNSYQLFWVAVYSSFSLVFFMLFTGLHARMMSFYVWPFLTLILIKFPRIKLL